MSRYRLEGTEPTTGYRVATEYERDGDLVVCHARIRRRFDPRRPWWSFRRVDVSHHLQADGHVRVQILDLSDVLPTRIEPN